MWVPHTVSADQHLYSVHMYVRMSYTLLLTDVTEAPAGAAFTAHWHCLWASPSSWVTRLQVCWVNGQLGTTLSNSISCRAHPCRQHLAGHIPTARVNGMQSKYWSKTSGRAPLGLRTHKCCITIGKSPHPLSSLVPCPLPAAISNWHRRCQLKMAAGSRLGTRLPLEVSAHPPVKVSAPPIH